MGLGNSLSPSREAGRGWCSQVNRQMENSLGLDSKELGELTEEFRLPEAA